MYFKVIASFVFNSVWSILDLNVKFPTAPLKFAGLFLSGKGFTLMVNGFDLRLFSTF